MSLTCQVTGRLPAVTPGHCPPTLLPASETAASSHPSHIPTQFLHVAISCHMRWPPTQLFLTSEAMPSSLPSQLTTHIFKTATTSCLRWPLSTLLLNTGTTPRISPYWYTAIFFRQQQAVTLVACPAILHRPNISDFPCLKEVIHLLTKV